MFNFAHSAKSCLCENFCKTEPAKRHSLNIFAHCVCISCRSVHSDEAVSAAVSRIFFKYRKIGTCQASAHCAGHTDAGTDVPRSSVLLYHAICTTFVGWREVPGCVLHISRAVWQACLDTTAAQWSSRLSHGTGSLWRCRGRSSGSTWQGSCITLCRGLECKKWVPVWQLSECWSQV